MALFELKDQYFIDVRIGRKDFSIFDFFGIPEIDQIEVNHTLLEKLVIIESIDQFVPTFEFRYRPQLPTLQEILPITGFDPLTIAISKNREKSSDRPSESYYILSTEPNPSFRQEKSIQPLVIRGHLYPIKFLLSSQRKTYQGTISNVMEEFMQPVVSGQNIDIEPTHPQQTETYIQPGWSNGDFLQYLKNRAVAERGKLSDYVAFFRSNGDFVFKTVDALFRESRPSDELSRWWFADNVDINNGTDYTDPAGNTVKNVILDYKFEHNAMVPVGRSALGHTASTYNWETGEYNESTRNITDINRHTALTDKYLFSEQDFLQDGFSTSKRGHWHGRTRWNQFHTAMADRQVLKSNREITSMIVTVVQQVPENNIGQKIKIELLDNNMVGDRQNVLSGEWLIHSRIRHITDELIFKYRLIRDGINTPPNKPFRFANTPNKASR